MATMATSSGYDEAGQQMEGRLATAIEEQTAKMPSDAFLWAAVGSIGASLVARALGYREGANFIGLWAPTFLLLGTYNKIVKVAGHDRARAD